MLPVSSPSGPLTASSRFYKICAQVLLPSFRRHQTTARRTRSRLNIKPDASFLPTKTEQHDHIIFNPPPSMPNVYHTPNIFLPKNDQRKIQKSSSQQLPPPIPKQPEKRYHLTETDLAEMRSLRSQDPLEWSVKKLAKKFNCSNLFVMFVTEKLAGQKKEQQEQVTALVKSRWSDKKRIAREDRDLRKEKWFSDA
ncbi:hypothetical protein B0A52_01168 [Exophiala mesophila]|uniref:Ribosomal protein L20 n=1 Tax=Exophiala mesophila TaxID=212818 RepID=A0A438NGP1_EXOME|nr:hypothetical protein B0A52_01168 [Exophiala mesophila]